MARYKKLKEVIEDTELGRFIPMVRDNSDFMEYLKWRAEGNLPDEGYDPELEAKQEADNKVLANIQSLHIDLLKELCKYVYTLASCPQSLKDKIDKAEAEYQKLTIAKETF